MSDMAGKARDSGRAMRETAETIPVTLCSDRFGAHFAPDDAPPMAKN